VILTKTGRSWRRIPGDTNFASRRFFFLPRGIFRAGASAFGAVKTSGCVFCLPPVGGSSVPSIEREPLAGVSTLKKLLVSPPLARNADRRSGFFVSRDRGETSASRRRVFTLFRNNGPLPAGPRAPDCDSDEEERWHEETSNETHRTNLQGETSKPPAVHFPRISPSTFARFVFVTLSALLRSFALCTYSLGYVFR